MWVGDGVSAGHIQQYEGQDLVEESEDSRSTCTLVTKTEKVSAQGSVWVCQ